MVIFTVSLLGWIVLVLRLQELPSTLVCLLLSGLILSAGLWFRVFRPLALSFCVAIVILGLALFEAHTQQLRSHQLGQDIRVTVKVSDVPTVYEWGQRFRANVIECLSCDGSLDGASLQLGLYGKQIRVRSGEYWALTVRLKPFRGFRNSGSFDQAQWALYKGLDARGYVRSKPMPVRLADSASWDLQSSRQALSDRVSQLPAASLNVGVVQALILGLRQGIERPIWQVLRDTGTAHLLAISGLHVSLFATGLYWLTLKTIQLLCNRRMTSGVSRIGRDVHGIALFGSVSGASVYSLLAGFELPVQRALAMLLVWSIATYRCRNHSPAWALSFALLGVILVSPLSSMSSGFWLSFGTVGMLFYLHRGHVRSTHTEFLKVQETGVGSLIDRAVPMLKTHVLLGLLLLPITAWFFQSGSLVSPLANLLAIPWVGLLVVPLSFAAVLLSGLWSDAANWFLSIAQWSIDILLGFLSYLADIESASISLSLPDPLTLFISLTGLLVLVVPKGLGLRWFSIPLLIPMCVYNGAQQRLEGFEVHTLDVGQGLAVLVFTKDHTLLYDTGGKLTDTVSLFDSVVMPYMRANGRHKIDYLIVSHDDEDHAFGLGDATHRFPDAQVYVGGDFILEVDQRKASNQQTCAAGVHWQVDDIEFAFLHPSAERRGTDNNQSCVLMIYKGRSRVVITGDIEKQGERTLVRNFSSALAGAFTGENNTALSQDHPLTTSDLEDVNLTKYSKRTNTASEQFPISLLIAPHHGSNSSSTAELLALLHPSNVIFPAGFLNRYGFPHDEVQLRYKRVGSKQYNTGLQGAIVFAFDQFGVLGKPLTWWQTNRRFWHGFLDPVCVEKISAHAPVFRQILLAQKGQTLCGK